MYISEFTYLNEAKYAKVLFKDKLWFLCKFGLYLQPIKEE